MKRELPFALVFMFGLFMVLQYFVPMKNQSGYTNFFWIGYILSGFSLWRWEYGPYSGFRLIILKSVKKDGSILM